MIYLIIYFLIILLISGIYQLAWNKTGNYYCIYYKKTKGDCQISVMQRYSLENAKGNDNTNVYPWLNLCSCIALMFSSLALRKYQSQIKTSLDEEFITPADYSIMI